MILITQLSENYGEKNHNIKINIDSPATSAIQCFSSWSLQYDVFPAEVYNTLFLQLKLKYLKLYPCRVEKCYNPAKGEFVVNYRRTEIGRNTHAEI